MFVVCCLLFFVCCCLLFVVCLWIEFSQYNAASRNGGSVNMIEANSLSSSQVRSLRAYGDQLSSVYPYSNIGETLPIVNQYPDLSFQITDFS